MFHFFNVRVSLGKFINLKSTLSSILEICNYTSLSGTVLLCFPTCDVLLCLILLLKSNVALVIYKWMMDMLMTEPSFWFPSQFKRMV